MKEPMSRYKELGDFLKTRRAKISPLQVGLPEGLHRRTPGLRREEVATLSGVGITWYTCWNKEEKYKFQHKYWKV